MALNDELATLSGWIAELRRIGVEAIASNKHVFAMDYIVLGGVKRSLNLVSGFHAMVVAKNVTCARAILRMQVDTVSRLLAYTYVDRVAVDRIATEVINGSSLKKFVCREGKRLSDGYLIDRMARQVPWVRDLYNFTSGDVHFSSNQVEDSIVNIREELKEIFNRDGGLTEIHLTHVDEKYPESYWEEITRHFLQLLEMLKGYLADYSEFKAAVTPKV